MLTLVTSPVYTYVAATDDDPAGTPTWGSWVVAAGEAQAVPLNSKRY
jgi:hypothetical protein